MTWKRPCTVLQLFLIGVAIRLLLMPWFMHLDLLTDYWVAHLTAFKAKLPLDIEGGIYCFSVMHYFHAFVLKVLSLFFPSFELIWSQPWGLPDRPGMTTFTNWYHFSGFRSIFPTLFFLKLPYFLADCFAFRLVLKLADNESERKFFSIFWLFNPVILFVTYCFGRYEIIPAVFILWSLVMLKEGKVRVASLLLGISLVLKLYGLMLVPLFVLTTAKGFRERVTRFFWVMGPGLLMILSSIVLKKVHEFSTFTTLSHNDYLLGLQLLIHPNNQINYQDILFLFPLFYGILLFKAEREPTGWKSFVIHGFIFFQGLYGLSFYHPHYFFWIMPFWAFVLLWKKEFGWYFLLQLFLVFVYSFHWMRDLAGHLMMPIAPVFFSGLPSPFEVINTVYPADKFLHLMRSFSTALSLWLIYLTTISFQSVLDPERDDDGS